MRQRGQRFLAAIGVALVLALGLVSQGCTSSNYCTQCDQERTVLSLHYPASTFLTEGGTSASLAPNPTGGVPTGYSVVTGSLPPGLLLDASTGLVTGSATLAGVYPVTLTGASATGNASQAIIITVEPGLALTLSYPTPRSFQAGVAMAAQLPTLGLTTAGLSSLFKVSAGTLAPGMVLNTDGSITGKPGTVGTYLFSITVSNGSRSATAQVVHSVQADPVGPLGWTIQQGSNATVSYPATTLWTAQGERVGYNIVYGSPDLNGSDDALETVGTDPYITTPPMTMVFNEPASLRVGNAVGGTHIAKAYQDLLIPAGISQSQLSFYWAAVLQSAGHGLPDQPYADILIQDVSNPNNVITLYFRHYPAQDPAFTDWVVNNDWGAVPWSQVVLPNLALYAGHTLRITATAADCDEISLGSHTGHGGYLYLETVNYK